MVSPAARADVLVNASASASAAPRDAFRMACLLWPEGPVLRRKIGGWRAANVATNQTSHRDAGLCGASSLNWNARQSALRGALSWDLAFTQAGSRGDASIQRMFTVLRARFVRSQHKSVAASCAERHWVLG
jgi:hypothetical protein